MDPPGTALNPTFSLAPLIVLIFSCLCKGVLSQNTRYEQTVPANVSVQEGLCVHIPCSFTYDASDRRNSVKLWVYWIQREEGNGESFTTRSYQRIQGLLVATNDDWLTLQPSVVNRFQLTGKPAEGNCSLSILNARRQDTGKYYFRIESGTMKYNYVSNRNRDHTALQVLVTELTEKPQLRNSPAVLAGKEAVFTCSAQGPCSGVKPEIRWIFVRPGYKTPQWSDQHTNGSWTYGSNFTFTPSLNDQGKSLTCRVQYPDIEKQVENSILLDIADPPKIVRISTNSTYQEHHAVCAQETKEGLDFAVAQEGESVALLCEAQSGPAPALSWTKGNRTLNESTQGKELPLLLSEVRPKDAGEYQCQAETVYGSAEKTVQLCVLYPPRTVAISVYQAYKRGQALIQDTPTHVASGSQLTAQEGSSLRLHCTAPSYPPSETSWVKGSRIWEHQSPSPDNWLELTDLTAEDAGQYVCQARNSPDSVEGTVQLSVAYGPRLSSNQSRSTCWREANSLHCKCALRSWPPPQIQWQVDGQTLSEDNLQEAKQVTSQPQTHNVISSLSWATGNVDENHTIVCLGSNPLGTYTLHFVLFTPAKGNPASLLVAGLCGGLLAAVLGVFCLCLIKFYKQKKAKATQKAGGVMNSTHGGHQRGNDGSLIYSNVSPLGRKPPHADHSSAAKEKTSASIPRVLGSRTAEPEELYYATLEFSKLKAKESVAPEESVEYSEVKKK